MITLEKLKVAKEMITQQLAYLYFKEYYKLVPIDWSKQQKLDADYQGIQQINFTETQKKASISFIIEETKESVLDFSKGAVKVLWFYFALIKY